MAIKRPDLPRDQQSFERRSPVSVVGVGTADAVRMAAPLKTDACVIVWLAVVVVWRTRLWAAGPGWEPVVRAKATWPSAYGGVWMSAWLANCHSFLMGVRHVP